MSNETRTYLLRLSGTISTKSARTRSRFVQRLEQNVREALDRRGIDYEFEREWSRLFVHSSDDRAGDVLPTVAGIQSVRPSNPHEWDSLDDLVETGRRLYAERVEGRTFGVRARRVGQRDRFPFTSTDINRELGTALVESGGEVDLDDPEVEVRLELHYETAYFFDEDIPGPGGLPVGSEGRALALVSGGFDSAVAAWTMLKRGVALDFLFFNLGGPAHERGVREVIGWLGEQWCHGYEPNLHVVDFRPVIADLKVDAPGQYWQVLLKRMMFRAAESVADDVDSPAIVTGEAIGQVSSQTMANLAAIEAPIDVPVFRPLIGYNKEDIVELSRRIGIHDRAERVPEFCALEGGNPVTNTTPERLDRHEESIDLEVVERLSDDRRIEKLREAAQRCDEDLDVQVDRVPNEATFLDLRAEPKYESWHPDGAVHVPFETALEQFAMLPREPTWLVYCDVGLKSALLAEKMQQSGFDAHSFRGGVPKLRAHLDSSQDP